MKPRLIPAALAGCAFLALLAGLPAASADPCIQSGATCVEVHSSNVCVVDYDGPWVSDQCVGASGVCHHWYPFDGVELTSCTVGIGVGGHNVCVLYSESYSSPPPTYYQNYLACV